MSDTILGYLVSLGIIGAGVVRIVAGTIWTASDLCIAIGIRCLIEREVRQHAHLLSSPSGLLVIIPNELGAIRTRADADQFSRASV
jgi:hypothetical protein